MKLEDIKAFKCHYAWLNMRDGTYRYCVFIKTDMREIVRFAGWTCKKKD